MSETWKFHPEHPLYICSTLGKVKTVDDNLKEVNLPKFIDEEGNHLISIFRKTTYETTRKIKVSLAKFIYTCFNGQIHRGLRVYNLNGDLNDYSIDNLGVKKLSHDTSRVRRDMTKITGGNPHKSRMPILIESITGDKLIFKSKNQCAIYLNVNPAMVYFAVKRQNGIE